VGILVNQKSIAITINLHDALLRLRHESGSQPRLVWADAICINQKDKKEQSSQVQMMGKIYEYARCVPVWLGADDGNIAKDSFDLMKETARACRELLERYGGPTQIPQPMPENPFCQDVEKWGKLDALVSLPWFKRVWVKQEVGLAAQSVLMLGNESLDLKDMIEIPLLGFVRGDLFPPNHTTLEGMRDTFIEIWRSYGNSISWRNELSGNILRSIVEKEQESSFLKVLHVGRTFQATNPRDHVYAFLGHPTSLDPKTRTPLVNVDYTKSIFDVYYDTACAVLKAYPSNLTFLLSCVDRDRKALEENFPTWVPQWHRARPVSAFGYPSESMDDPDVQFTLLEDKSLKLSGLVFDEISWISSPMTRSDFDPTTAPLKIRPLPVISDVWRYLLKKYPIPEYIWQKILQHNLGSQYGAGRLDAFIMTMTAGRVLEGDDMAQYRSSFHAYCATIGASITGITLDKQTKYTQNGDAGLVERDIKWATNNRRFFSTKSGYFGLGHDPIQIDDACCFFTGVRLPFIIRPTQNVSRYKLVGDAYIHGVSNGEILEKKCFPIDIILQ
jgi:hypothetical protein